MVRYLLPFLTCGVQNLDIPLSIQQSDFTALIRQIKNTDTNRIAPPPTIAPKTMNPFFVGLEMSIPNS